MVLQLGLRLQASAHEPSSVVGVFDRRGSGFCVDRWARFFMHTFWIEEGCMDLATLVCEIQPRTKAAAPATGLLIGFWVFAKGKAAYAFCHHFSKYRAKCVCLNKDEIKEAELKKFNFTNWFSTGVGGLGRLLKPRREVSQNRLKKYPWGTRQLVEGGRGGLSSSFP